VFVVVAMAMVVGFLTVGFVVGLVLAEFADRRRAIELVADASRLAPQALNPRLPW
jgi:hypothetical protein